MIRLILIAWIGILPVVTVAALCVLPRFHDRVIAHIKPPPDMRDALEELSLIEPVASAAPSERAPAVELLAATGQHVGDRA